MTKKVMIFVSVLAILSNVAYANELLVEDKSIDNVNELSLTNTNYEVAVNTLNVRASDSTSSKVLGKLSKKEKIAVLQIKNNWAKISYKSTYGYVHTSYIKKISSTNIITLTKYIVNTDDLNIRSSASSSSKILGKLNIDDTVEVYSISNNWAKIKNGSSIGYVYSKYIDKYINNITPDTPNTPSTPELPKPDENPISPPLSQQTYTKYTTIANSLNVRASKSASSKKLGALSNGTTVNVYNITNDWAEIKYNNQKAYISASYISKLIDTNKLNSINVLVNKSNSLGKNYAPSDLITLNVKFKSGIASNAKKMRKEPGKALEQMFIDAKKDKINLVMYSGYRSYSTQKSIYASNVSYLGSSKADLVSAKAGLSEHQTGLSVDVVSSDYLKLDTGFAKTKAYKWLVANAANYGFIIRYPIGKTNITGYSFEPWHLRYVGVDSAKEITSRKITLEEYLK